MAKPKGLSAKNQATFSPIQGNVATPTGLRPNGQLPNASRAPVVVEKEGKEGNTWIVDDEDIDDDAGIVVNDDDNDDAYAEDMEDQGTGRTEDAGWKIASCWKTDIVDDDVVDDDDVSLADDDDGFNDDRDGSARALYSIFMEQE